MIYSRNNHIEAGAIETGVKILEGAGAFPNFIGILGYPCLKSEHIWILHSIQNRYGKSY